MNEKTGKKVKEGGCGLFKYTVMCPGSGDE
jgi:hypothetical protein